MNDERPGVVRQVASSVGRGIVSGVKATGRGFAEGGKAFGHGVANAADTIKTKWIEAHTPAESVTLADLFNRKLYNFVDFDYVLNYLRSNKLAACSNVHTIKSLSYDIVPKLTEIALKERNVKKVNKAYVGIMHLCKRRRKNLLVYFNLEGHATMCLIKTWQGFCEYAEFSSLAEVNSLTFRSEEVFPQLRVNRNLNNAREIQIEDVPVETEHEVRQADVFGIEDRMGAVFPDVSRNAGTQLFDTEQGSSAANSLHIMAARYDSIVNGTVNWGKGHHADNFLYYIYFRKYPNRIRLTTVRDFCNELAILFNSVRPEVNTGNIYQFIADSDNSVFEDLKNVLGIVPKETESVFSNNSYEDMLFALADSLFFTRHKQGDSFYIAYKNEIQYINQLKTDFQNSMSDTSYLKFLSGDEDICKIVPNALDEVKRVNEKIFPQVYSNAISGNIIRYTFNEVLYLFINNVIGITYMSLQEFPANFQNAIKKVLPDTAIDWLDVCKHTDGEIMLAYRVACNIKSVDASKNDLAVLFLKKAIEKYYKLNNCESKSWQEIYNLMLSSGVSMSASTISTTRAVDVLGVDINDLNL